MRNWHTAFQSILPFHLLTSIRRTLPMRNWHGNKIYFFWKLPISSRTLPMRNWHLIVGIYPADIPFHVGHYLWGIDTSQKENKTQNQQNKNRRTLPMRNWHLNAWFNSSSSLLHSCWSDITYEELTLAYPKLLDCPIKVVQVRRTLPMRNWHEWSLLWIQFETEYLSDITYEELTLLEFIQSTIV